MEELNKMKETLDKMRAIIEGILDLIPTDGTTVSYTEETI